MKKRILTVLISIVTLVSMYAGGSQEKEASPLNLMQEGTLTIGVEIGYPPFEDFANDGVTPVGYDIDFAKALGEKLGLEIVFINTAWDGIFQGIGVNYDVVISAVTITEERKETMDFSTPYIDNYQAVVVRADSDRKVTKFQDLDGLALAVQKETTSDILISDYISTGSLNCTVAQNEKVITCFTQLDNKEIDAVVVDSTVADGQVGKYPGKYKIAYLDKSEAEQFGVALTKGNTALQSAINKAIDDLKKEGFFQENTEYWFGG
ncbi:transporter substrate-binding domain-containing protein [Spirochaeta isovalerica]|uniref:Polar amino acid transport system substrate-binding protein n=1 Tax=Spirochaeta isovalerica TaxID=150 RepID=A0A841RAQ5_9SPIO|nr:transporter substrate-binding domain-containing protein [Spirochaeta isovalerica]MBB6481025.1 polar amino acid transport system substrate-binding protein [Spirochaeta isovalerica]